MNDWDTCWRQAWQDLGIEVAGPRLERMLADLLARYSEPQRHYHTLQHLDECFAGLQEMRDAAARPGELGLALWFHDAVYDPRRRDNEARSRDLAEACLREAAAPAPVVQRVGALIDATSHHEAGDDPDCAILLDLDLAILGAPPPRFAQYEQQIRAEYAHVAPEAYRDGRARVLHGFLARPRIYATAHCFGRYEEQARANLTRALAI